jgi:uncharacterized protein YndB with AHSA1/START domain
MSNEIEKTIELKAPLERVWWALTVSREFGSWFGVAFDEPFVAGKVATGHFTHQGGERMRWNATVDQIVPMTLFSFRWHPYALDPDTDYSGEEPTLIRFDLEPIAQGVRLRITETGFDKVPEYRRAEALRMNTRGWGIQADRIKAYVEG